MVKNRFWSKKGLISTLPGHARTLKSISNKTLDFCTSRTKTILMMVGDAKKWQRFENFYFFWKIAKNYFSLSKWRAMSILGSKRPNIALRIISGDKDSCLWRHYQIMTLWWRHKLHKHLISIPEKLTHLNYKYIVLDSFSTKTLTVHISRHLTTLPVTCLLPVCFILFEQGTHII